MGAERQPRAKRGLTTRDRRKEKEIDMIRGLGNLFDKENSIEKKYKINVCADEEEILGYNVCQLQQMRRLAKGRCKLPWYDSRCWGAYILAITYRELVLRGAIREAKGQGGDGRRKA